MLLLFVLRSGYPSSANTGKNNRFPFLDIFGYLKNTHKNPKFGRVRQVPIRELGWEFPGWDLSHFAEFGIFMGTLKYPKMGIRHFFLCKFSVYNAPSLLYVHFTKDKAQTKGKLKFFVSTYGTLSNQPKSNSLQKKQPNVSFEVFEVA